ncbi:MAG TPA: VWA domain-containing protein [Capsulimonadaceae bacterium]|jgi:Ca-activated chloride channel family protein
MKLLAALLAAFAVVLMSGCQHDSPPPPPVAQFVILSGSENKTLEPIVQEFAKSHNVAIHFDYRGSVDVMQALRADTIDANAVWPANSLWISMGDTKHRVKDSQSIMWSPVVLAVKQSKAKALGWIGKKVTVNDVLNAAEADHLKFMMTSATQSNSGACAYLGFLYAFAGKPDMLTDENLTSKPVQAKIKRILGQVNRSAGSSGWLKDLFLQKYSSYDAMFNYESLAIEANQQLVARGDEPLQIVYPSDGLAIADSPLGYVDKGNEAQHTLFTELQQYLLSSQVQQRILALGRRVGPVGAELPGADKSVYNPAWGISLTHFLNQIKYPKASVISDALDLYQTAFRKPSYTVYVLDYSGSMGGDREKRLKAAMHSILDQATSRRNLLQAASGDVTRVIAFNNGIIGEWKVTGNNPSELAKLDAKLSDLAPGGGTDIYTPVIRAISRIQAEDADGSRFPSVVLMTDGESNTGMSFADFHDTYQRDAKEQDVPVYGILFGDASSEQLKQLSETTTGRMFDGTKDLAAAFREAKGYN